MHCKALPRRTARAYACRTDQEMGRAAQGSSARVDCAKEGPVRNAASMFKMATASCGLKPQLFYYIIASFRRIHMRRFIGDRAFYWRVVVIVLPIIIQNTITNLVSLVDNVMVGRVGTEQMSGVAIANQLLFVFNLCIFGGLSGAGIFSAQFFGQGNHDGVRSTFRFKLLTGAFVLIVALAVFIPFGPTLISHYLTDGEGAGDLALTFLYGKSYMRIMLLGLLPFALTQCYSGTLREMNKTTLPMVASIIAVLTNLFLNWILIYGKFGFPELGSDGAAYATVISRFVELAIVVTVTHRHKMNYPFIVGAYRSLRIPAALAKSILIKGAPLLINEALWSMGIAMLNQNYSLRGLAVIAALNISSTISNLFNVVYMSMGNAIAIMVGQELGSGNLENAKDVDRKLIALNISSCLVMGTLLFCFAPAIPIFYKTTDAVRGLATTFIRVSACCMPIYACAHSCYFTLRSGGKTIITFMFDSGYTWLVSIPLSFSLVRLTTLQIIPIFVICQLADLIKCTFGLLLVKKGIWVNNIVTDATPTEEQLPVGN